MKTWYLVPGNGSIPPGPGEWVHTTNNVKRPILRQHAPPCPVLVHDVTRVSLLGFLRQRAFSCPLLLQEIVNASMVNAVERRGRASSGEPPGVARLLP